MTWYWKRMHFLLYFLINGFKYRLFSFRSFVYFSVRVEGKKFISIGKGAIIQRQGWLIAIRLKGQPEPEMVIGQGCAIGDFCHISSVRSVIIEDQVLIANKVYISDNLHEFRDVNKPIIQQDVVFKGAVRIGSGAWIGENVCIIGASVGKNSVIGANSVVTKDIPDYSVAVGCPAKVIKKFNPATKEWDIAD